MCEQNFETLIRARYPLILVQSYEEDRVVQSIKKIGAERKAQVLLWSITKGLRTPDSSNPMAASPKPTEMLMALSKSANVDTLVILQDFHPYLQDPTVVRALRDVAEDFRMGKAKRTLVLISPMFSKIPPEIEKQTTLFDWDLPSMENLARLAASTKIPLKSKTSIEDIAQAALGLTEVEAESAYAKSAVLTGTLDPVRIQEEKKQIIKKSGLLEFLEPAHSFADVGGMDILKTWLQRRRQAFTQKAKDFNLPKPRGILALGPPGTGKSLIAKAFAANWNFPLLQLDMGKVFQGLVGSSEENMRKVLKTAEAVSPCIVFVDEIEKALSGTGSSGSTDGGTTSRVFATLLTWMQEKKHDVFVIATANDVSSLPPELLRKGRFDDIFFIDLPQSDDRRRIFEIHLRKVARDPSAFDLDPLVKATEGYTGAEIEQVVHSALYLAFDADRDITNLDLAQAQRDILPLSQTMKEKIDKVREWAKGRARFASSPAQEPIPVFSGRFGSLS